MTIVEREQQILRVKEQSFQPEIEEALEQKLREGVLEVVKMTLVVCQPKNDGLSCQA